MQSLGSRLLHKAGEARSIPGQTHVQGPACCKVKTGGAPQADPVPKDVDKISEDQTDRNTADVRDRC